MTFPAWIKKTLLVLILILAPSGVCRGQEAVIMSVFLNTVPMGETFGYITPYGDVLLKVDFLREIGIVADLNEVQIEGQAVAYLKSLVSYFFDYRTLVLNMTADPGVLGKSSFDLGRIPPEDLVYLEYDSAFLNYSVNCALEEEADVKTWDVPLEAGVRLVGLLFHSTFDYSRADTRVSFARLMSRVVKDDRKSLTRYTLGDFSASTGELGGSAVMGGINVQKNYTIDPFFPRYNSLDFSGAVASPSKIEIWKDGTLMDTIDVGPGRFELEDLPIAAGSGKVLLVIKDAFGREERVEVPYYHSTFLLKKGSHEFSYSAGSLRENLGEEDTGYGEPVFLMSHRYGLTRFLTTGVRAEAGEDISSAGLSLVFTMGRAGLFEADASASWSDSGDGDAYLVGYSYAPAKGGFGFNLRQSGFSLEYGNLSLSPLADRPRRSIQVSLSRSLGNFGTLALSFSEDDYHFVEDTRRIAVSYSTRLMKNLSLSAGGSRVEDPERVDEVYASLNYSFGQGMTANLFQSRSDLEGESSLAVQKSVSERHGVGYRAAAMRLEPEEGEATQNASGDVNYYHDHGILTGRLNDAEGTRTWDLSARGSVAFLDGAFHLGQPVNDSFAVVKVGGAEGVKVYHDNLLVSRTDSRGEVYVPYLGGYYVSKLGVDELDLPFNYTLRRDEMNVSVPYRGGALVEFEVDRIQHVVGKMSVVRNGQSSPAKYWGLRIIAGGKEIVAPIGSEGQFYLENIPPGTHEVTIYRGETECRFELGIPESVDVEIDVGTLTCELD